MPIYLSIFTSKNRSSDSSINWKSCLMDLKSCLIKWNSCLVDLERSTSNLLFFPMKDIAVRNPFSLFNVTHFLCFAYLLLCSPDRSAISSSFQTVESKFIIKSIKIRVQNLAYHQKSINSSSIIGEAGNKSPKSGISLSVREISTLPPKPRVERSSRSVPAID